MPIFVAMRIFVGGLFTLVFNYSTTLLLNQPILCCILSHKKILEKRFLI